MSGENILHSNYLELIDERGLVKPDTPAGFEQLLFDTAAIRWGSEYGPNAPPEYLYHVKQVEFAALNMVGTSIMADDPWVNHRTIELADTHDIGRFMHFGKYHPIIGARVLQHMNFDGATEFAVDHHRMGMGLPVMGERSMAQIAFDFEQGRSEVDPVVIFHEKYGLPGCAVLVADSSKAIDTPGNDHLSRIVPFSAELFDSLMQRQFMMHEQDSRKGYAPGSPRHRVELAGRDMILRMIDFLADQYGVDYNRAIEQAQEGWPAQEARIRELWEDALVADMQMAA